MLEPNQQFSFVGQEHQCFMQQICCPCCLFLKGLGTRSVGLQGPIAAVVSVLQIPWSTYLVGVDAWTFCFQGCTYGP